MNLKEKVKDFNQYLINNIKLDNFRNIGELQKYIDYLAKKYFESNVEIIYEPMLIPIEQLPDGKPFFITGLPVIAKNDTKVRVKVQKYKDFIQLLKD